MATSQSPSSARLTSPSSDSENYDANHSNLQSSASLDPEPSSNDDSSSPLILYSPPTFWSILRGAAINLLLPFVNGLMLGFGELVAHEAAWRLGWSGTKIFPSHRSGDVSARPVGPGVMMVDDPVERRRRSGEEMDAYTALE